MCIPTKEFARLNERVNAIYEMADSQPLMVVKKEFENIMLELEISSMITSVLNIENIFLRNRLKIFVKDLREKYA